MALYVFQFGLMQPIASVVNSQLPTAVFTIFLLIIMVQNNGLKLRKYVLNSFFVVTIYFFINWIMFYNFHPILFKGYFDFLAKGFSAFLFASLEADEEYLYKAFEKVAIVNAFVLFFHPFTGLLSSMNYMRFGYAIIPSVLFFWLRTLNSNKHRFQWGVASILLSIIVIVYGSRGVIIVLCIFFISYWAFLTSISLYQKMLLATFFSIVSLFVIRLDIPLKLLEFVYYDLEFNTYAIRKLLMSLELGVAEASSGRDDVYIMLLEYFKLRPACGNGIFFSNKITGFHAHNIFFQILVESGVLGILFWSAVWSYLVFLFYKIQKFRTRSLISIILVLFAVSVGRLLVSSDMWLRPEYWFLISLVINYSFKKSLKTNIDNQYK